MRNNEKPNKKKKQNDKENLKTIILLVLLAIVLAGAVFAYYTNIKEDKNENANRNMKPIHHICSCFQ